MDSPGGLVYSIPRSLIELGRFTPTTFDQFVTPMNVRQPSTCYFDHCNIFLVYKFCTSLTDKILKKKTSCKIFTSIFVTFLFPVLRCLLLVYTKQRNNIYKNILFCTLECVFSCLSFLKNKRQAHIDLLCSERTQFCCLNIHLFQLLDI